MAAKGKRGGSSAVSVSAKWAQFCHSASYGALFSPA